jgi:SAM-dependent methyltransferase
VDQHTVKRIYPRLDIDDLAAVIRESIASQTYDDKVNGSAAPSLGINETDQAPPEFPTLKLQPDFQPRSDNRYHVNDLLQYHDRVFVQSAYRAILKRSPDAAELERGLRSLQSGRLNKIDLLGALRFSVEGKTKRVQIEGLSFPRFIRRLGRVPVVGYFIRLAVALVRLPKFIADQREFAGYVLAKNQQIADFVNSASVRDVEFRRDVSVSNETLSNRLQPLEALPAALDGLKEEQQVLRHQQVVWEDQTNVRFGEIQQQLSAGLGALEARLVTTQTGLEGIKAGLETLENEIAAFKEHLESRLQADQQRLQTQIEEDATKLELLKSAESKLFAEVERFQLQLQQVRAELTLQGRNINVMLGPAKENLSAAQPEAEAHRHDALYVALEDRFRGTRAEVKERLSFYLPFIKAIPDEPEVLDIGCGRGEWLELLKEDGIKASGVDMNSVLVERCREQGLEVVAEDAIVYLRKLPDKSLGAVTGFHIIEHVSLDQLLSLLDEVMRVLVPGGVAIFETPNPDNVLVGSNYFYFDPTHRHPLPSQLMHFLFETRGFQRTEVINLHPWESARIQGGAELTERFNDYFFGPMDYAVLGWKS